MTAFPKYTFSGHSGYLFQNEAGGAALGHTALLQPWSDPAVHLHEKAEELYLLRQGELHFWLAGRFMDLRAGELLLVRARVEHAIVGGRGRIEHFGLRCPAARDKQVTGPLPRFRLPFACPDQREIVEDWGCRISLNRPANQNCWLVGQGQARFDSAALCLAYLSFPNHASANFDTFFPVGNSAAPPHSRQTLHFHRRSWEYYVVLQGAKRFQIEGERVDVQAGEALAVPPGTPHLLLERLATYEGFTFRAPLALDDRVECAQAGEDLPLK